MAKKISLTGNRELDKAFKRMPKALSKKVVRGALREASRPMVKEARSNVGQVVNQKTGALKRSLGIISDRSKEFKGSVRVGARMKKGSKNMQGWHAHLIEFGTAPRVAKNGKKLAFRGKDGKMVFAKKVDGVKARPFLRPAYRSTHKKVTEEFGEIAGNRLHKEMNRVIAKGVKRR